MSQLLVAAKKGEASAVRELIEEMVPVIANLARKVQHKWEHYYELDDVIWMTAAYIPDMLESLDVEKAGEKWKTILACWCRNRIYNLLQALNANCRRIVKEKVNIASPGEDLEGGTVYELEATRSPKKEYQQVRRLYFDFLREGGLSQQNVEVFMLTFPLVADAPTFEALGERWGVSKQAIEQASQRLTEKWKHFYLESQCV